MTGQAKADEWTWTQLDLLARQHFGGRARALAEIVRRAAFRHEQAWRTSAQGVYRPTESMYALAMRWGLEKRGPVCPSCGGTLEVPDRAAPPGDVDPSVTLRLRVPPREGGLNVPQNLALCHAGCPASP